MHHDEAKTAALQQEIIHRIEAADLRIRATGVGESLEEVVRIAGDEFSGIGVALPAGDLRDYALSVIEQRPHKFNINM